MRVCIIGTGDGGSTAANQVRRLVSDAQIDAFSRRAELGIPPCEMPLVIGGSIASWNELVRGFRQDSFWGKRNIGLHLNTEVADIVKAAKSTEAAVVGGGFIGLEMKDTFVIVNQKMMTSKPGIFACGKITGGERHLITAASEGASTGMTVSEYLALEKVKRGDMFEGAKNGKYADEYLAML